MLAVAGWVVAGPAPAADAAACSGSAGVTVVVDFGALGGIQVGCAAGNPSSGLGALHAAGFGTTGTRKDGPGFVCRINGAPASDPCVVTPPTTAYWSYWHAPRGGSWSYSSVGAAGYDPAPGSVEGWSFGSGARPGIAPPAAPAPPPPPPAPPRATTKPKPTTKAPAPPANPGPVPPRAPGATARPGPTAGPTAGPAPGSAPGSAPGAPATSAPAPAPGSRSAGSSGPAATSGPAGSTALAGEATEAPPPTSDPSPLADPEDDDGGTPVAPFVLGAVVVAGLATAGAVVARRRA